MSEGPDEAQSRRLLIIGGSHDHLGGVEAFCDRSTAAMHERGGWYCDRITAETAYLTWSHVPTFVLSILHVAWRGIYRRPDVAWIQYVNFPDLFYVLIAKMVGLRVMVTPHLGSNWRSQSSRRLRGISERLLRLANRLALISWTQEKEIRLPGGPPRSLIRNFLPSTVLTTELVEADGLPPAMQLIHSSRLSEGKGTFLFVDVCRQLRDAGVPFQARITGTGDAETMSRLRTMIDEGNLQNEVLVLGRVPEDELLDHLRRSDVLIHLSRIDSYPLIILEAMTCSTVPVAMELAGARDMIETYRGLVVSIEQPVAETVEWLKACDLGALRASRLETARRVRTDYGWPRCANALAAALDACFRGDSKVVTQPELVDGTESRDPA